MAATQDGLKAQVDETRDMELVNRLDIINLKNEIEQLKMTLPQAIEQIPKEDLLELVTIAEKVKDIKALRQMLDELQELRMKLKEHPDEIRQLHEEIVDVKNRLAFHHGQQGTGMRTCEHCGTEMPGVAKFCKKCGQPSRHPMGVLV